MSTEKNSDSKAKTSSQPIYLPDVEEKIAELAYYKAEKRNFSPGHELDDWLEAEQEFRL